MHRLPFKVFASRLRLVIHLSSTLGSVYTGVVWHTRRTILINPSMSSRREQKSGARALCLELSPPAVDHVPPGADSVDHPSYEMLALLREETQRHSYDSIAHRAAASVSMHLNAER